jgi:hypothetical protein
MLRVIANILKTIASLFFSLFSKIIDRYEDRLIKKSEVIIKNISPNISTVIIPRTDWKEAFQSEDSPIQGDIMLNLSILIMIFIPLSLGSYYLIRELLYELITGKGGFLEPGEPWWGLLVGILTGIIIYSFASMAVSVFKSMLIGSDKIIIDKDRNEVIFISHFTLKLPFFKELSDKIVSDIKKVSIVMMPPSALDRLFNNQDNNLYLFMDKSMKLIAHRRNISEKLNIYNFINSQIN